jgi:hypothetical protein
MKVDLTPVQRRSLTMIERGFKVRRVTIEALFAKGFVTGTIAKPRLNDAGQRFVKHGELPTSEGVGG